MRILFAILICIASFSLEAQTLSNKELLKFQAAEKILQEYTNGFDQDSLSFEERVNLIHEFIPRFVAILKEKNSFLYPFDSLITVAKVQAPDNKFRIFTWQLKEPLGTYKYYGTMQMNSKDLVMYPLFDYSDTMMVHTQEILSTDNWYGGIYYNCLMNETEKGTYYTLLGLDDVDFVSRRKFLEVLHFNENDEAVFGAPIIEFKDSLGRHITTKSRFFMEFSDKAAARLNYDENQEIIIYDHVVPPSSAQEGAWFTYIPDGTYEGFEWKDNKWQWVEKIFHYSIGKPDSPPVPVPLNGKNKNIIGD